jgi:hypothetical protein
MPSESSQIFGFSQYFGNRVHFSRQAVGLAIGGENIAK